MFTKRSCLRRVIVSAEATPRTICARVPGRRGGPRGRGERNAVGRWHREPSSLSPRASAKVVPSFERRRVGAHARLCRPRCRCSQATRQWLLRRHACAELFELKRAWNARRDELVHAILTDAANTIQVMEYEVECNTM